MKHIQTTDPLFSPASGSTEQIMPFPTSGPLAIPMTNDYLFRALLQQNNKVLKGLISSLLHLDLEEINSVEITNPIQLGSSVTDKTFILDIRIILNNHTIINLEMQVINQHNWVERSLSYLCRNFDNLQSGEAYHAVKPAIQIGLLNFTLFPEHPEFYSTYQLLNVKNYSLYSDKLRLSVLDLTHTDLATDEDKSWQLDYWARLFKATTWEELNMLAQNNAYMAEASATVHQLSQEERIRMECEAREDHYRTQLGLQNIMDSQIDQIRSQSAEIESQIAEINAQAAKIESRTAEINAQAAKINSQAAEIESRTAEINSQAAEINSQAAEINALHEWMKIHGYDPAEALSEMENRENMSAK